MAEQAESPTPAGLSLSQKSSSSPPLNYRTAKTPNTLFRSERGTRTDPKNDSEFPLQNVKALLEQIPRWDLTIGRQFIDDTRKNFRESGARLVW